MGIDASEVSIDYLNGSINQITFLLFYYFHFYFYFFS